MHRCRYQLLRQPPPGLVGPAVIPNTLQLVRVDYNSIALRL